MVLLQIFSNTTATTLKRTALLAYPVHVILLIVSLRQRHRVIDNGYILVELLSVCCNDDELENV